MAKVYNRNFRLTLFPKAFNNCTPEAAKYAVCVSQKEDVKKGDCNAEFIKFKDCFQKEMKHLLFKK